MAYKKANTDHIKGAINGFPWEMSFTNFDTNNKVYLFNKTIRIILSNFIHHETIKFDGDQPWTSSQIKHLINGKNAKIISETTKAINLLQ